MPSDERIVLGPKPAKAHLRKRYDDYERARATEPWLLGTSLENDAAQTIVQLYAQRMKIEEFFRDAKCPRFGWALKYSGSRSLDRLDALLLIAAFAIAVVLLIGAAAAQTRIEKSLRASSKRAPQLSLFSVGCYVLALRIRISFGSVWKQFKRLRRENAALFPKNCRPSLRQPKHPAATSARFVLRRSRLVRSSIRLASMTLVGITQ